MPFFLSGSRSDQFEQAGNLKNLLPPCPDSPNCVRFSKRYKKPAEELYKSAASALQNMRPAELEAGSYSDKISAVFKIFIYKDDFAIQIESVDEASSLLHIRSSSREGHSDLGVNRRRVKRFLKILDEEL